MGENSTVTPNFHMFNSSSSVFKGSQPNFFLRWRNRIISALIPYHCCLQLSGVDPKNSGAVRGRVWWKYLTSDGWKRSWMTSSQGGEFGFEWLAGTVQGTGTTSTQRPLPSYPQVSQIPTFIPFLLPAQERISAGVLFLCGHWLENARRLRLCDEWGIWILVLVVAVAVVLGRISVFTSYFPSNKMKCVLFSRP